MTEKEKGELIKRILAEQTQGAKAQANSNVFQSGKNFGLRLATRIIEQFFIAQKGEGSAD